MPSLFTGDDLLALGLKPGPLIGQTLRTAERLAAEGSTREEILAELHRVIAVPTGHTGGPFAALAEGLLRERRWEHPRTIRDTPAPHRIWGREEIDEGAIHQLERACRLPVTIGGALMPDAHIGKGICIGGVVVCENAVIPNCVGVDIACRMMLSVVPVKVEEIERLHERLAMALNSETNFGVGGGFGRSARREHAVMEDRTWRDGPRELRGLRDRAWDQLGTSGSGNHFVEWGELRLKRPDRELGLEAGSHLALLSHSGSRGLGNRIAQHWAKIASDRLRLPKEYRELAWLPLDSAEGEAYWEAMNLAGRYASANHHLIHAHLLRAMGFEPIAQIENHHNFAWKEMWRGKEVIVHRKGATPAHAGEVGIIPGSMAAPGFLVRGKGSEESVHSASHGAGRRMSRTQAKRTIDPKSWARELRGAGVDLLGAGLDEAPGAYKDIRRVMALQSDLVETIAEFHPRIVKMDGSGSPPED